MSILPADQVGKAERVLGLFLPPVLTHIHPIAAISARYRSLISCQSCIKLSPSKREDTGGLEWVGRKGAVVFDGGHLTCR